MKICENIASLPEFEGAKTVLLYLPLKSEPDVSSLAGICRRRGKTAAYPKAEGDAMRFFASDAFVKGALGVYEPEGGREVFPDAFTVAVIPALAYRPDGHRLGRGGGYYDRFLSGFAGAKIGAAFGFAVLPSGSFDALPHDVPVDVIVTEAEVQRHS